MFLAYSDDMKASNVAVEYTNPSFLVGKPTGGGGTTLLRLSLASITVDSLNHARCQLYIEKDLSMASHRQDRSHQGILPDTQSKELDEILWHHHSLQGCCVYTRCAMGMPGLEMVLEIMCRVLGDLLVKSYIMKLAVNS